jgi:putative SOS response-associated peptidase YedK
VSSDLSVEHRDNFNMSPGMDALVIYMENGKLQMDHKKWGLITKSGTPKHPLYNTDKDIIKMCFANLCFNARSDTLHEKTTFSRLVHQGRTCIVALDGYFEWKATPLIKGKQPYFVYRQQGSIDQQREPLLIAGLWTRVKTGHEEAPELDSFTILTTESCQQIRWLHHRMPMCMLDIELALEWLAKPSEKLTKRLDDAARNNNDGFSWHKVTPDMSKLQFRGKEAIVKVKETTQSVKSFFLESVSKDGKSSDGIKKEKEKKSKNEIQGVAGESDQTEKAKWSHVNEARENQEKDVATSDSKKRQLLSTTPRSLKRETTPTSEKVVQITPKTLPISNKRAKMKHSSSPAQGSKQKSITSFFQQKT